jgi:hypothetical protein
MYTYTQIQSKLEEFKKWLEITLPNPQQDPSTSIPPPISLQCSLQMPPLKKLGLEAMNLMMGRERERREEERTSWRRGGGEAVATKEEGGGAPRAAGRRLPVAGGLEPPTCCCVCARA